MAGTRIDKHGLQTEFGSGYDTRLVHANGLHVLTYYPQWLSLA